MKLKLTFKKLDQTLRGEPPSGEPPKELIVSGTSFTIGRASNNDLQIDEPHISRHHMKLEESEGKVFLIKLSSKGKVLYDGKNIEKQELKAFPSTFEIPPYSFTLEVVTEEVIEKPQTFSTKSIEAEAKKEVSKLTPTPSIESFPFTIGEEEPKASEETRITQKPSKAKLIVLKGKSPYQSYDLLGDEITLGRDTKCDVRLDDSKISREHTKIFLKNNAYWIHDCGSTNGTFLNHARLTQDVALSSSDHIQIGDCLLQFALCDENIYALKPSETALTKLPSWEGEIASYGHKKAKSFVARFKIFFALGTILILGLAYLTMQHKPTPTRKTAEALRGKPPLQRETRQAPSDELSKLSQVDQDYVSAKFKEAKDFHKNRNYRKAQIALHEIFKIAPNYKPAKDLNTIIEETLEKQLQENQKVQASLEEKKLEEDIKYRLSVALDYFNRGQWEKAVEEYDKILELKPEHEEAQAKKQTAISKLEQKMERSQTQAPRVPKTGTSPQKEKNKLAEKLLAQGSTLSNQGKMLEALTVWRKVLNIEDIDPQYYAKADQFINFTKNKLQEKYTPLLTEAQMLVESKEYLAAKEILETIIKEYPSYTEAKTLLDKILFALHGIAKREYTEAIIEENVGRIDAAKEKFKWIVERIPASDEYHRKAKNKLKKYE